MQVTVDVSKEVLNWVADQSADAILPPIIKQYISDWIKGKKRPTLNQVEKVSKATQIPFGYFFLKRPPVEDLSIVEYRTIDSIDLLKPSRNLIDTVKSMECIQDWMHNYLNDAKDALSFVGAMKGQKDIFVFAEFIRETLSLKGDWRKGCNSAADLFRVIRTAMSNAGVLVMMNGIVGNNTHRPLNVREFRAFALVDDTAPLIFINNRDSANAKLFSLLHEFAHICLGENSLFNVFQDSEQTGKDNEILCNAVASEILIPTNEFLSEWEQSAETDLTERIKTIAKKYCCGMLVIARKALDYRKIDRQLYKAISGMVNKAYQDREKRESSGGNYYLTAASRIDHHFLLCLAESVGAGKTTYTEAFGLTKTNRKTYDNLIAKVGGQ